VLIAIGSWTAQASGQTPPADACPAEKAKLRVVEPKKNTKTVYNSVCKEYCLPRCSLWDLVRGWCGGCASCTDCGPVRARNVLVRQEQPRQPGRDLRRHLREIQPLARPGRKLDPKVIAVEVVIPLQRLDQQKVHRKPDRPAPVRVAAEQAAARLTRLIRDAIL